ncbi:phage tail assembly chaperone [Chakrabartyella piscis]|uniref:phage tail assembly chaperone n=1 Tax=Chakrabartyella piscis TaxID=2918914 RepID=UPI00295879CC|nr:hypothetical protein [Chakrabartyella piscis]
MILKEFLQEKNHLPEDKQVLVSKRFTKDGAPILWTLQGITEGDYRKSKQKEKDPWVALCLATITYPNLQDEMLWESYGVTNAASLLKEMLYPAEYGYLLEQVKLQNGFDIRRKELKEEAKKA